jgi:tetratricopeptide (TPR) repeat protein
LRPGVVYRHEVEGAADYLARSGFRGNIFNHYEDGGYLAWRLPPEIKLFIYGRMVYPELLTLYNDVINYPSKTFTLDATGAGRYYYQSVLDEFGINAVIIPAGERLTGDGVPLTMMLARDNTWALVYARPEALVFLRKTPAVAPLLRDALPKSAIYENQIVVARAAAGSAHGRSSPVWRRSLVIATYGLGRKEEALRMLDEYLALAPDDPKAVQFRERILREVGRPAR